MCSTSGCACVSLRLSYGQGDIRLAEYTGLADYDRNRISLRHSGRQDEVDLIKTDKVRDEPREQNALIGNSDPPISITGRVTVLRSTSAEGLIAHDGHHRN